MGWWYYRYSDDTSLGDLENEAKENKRGLCKILMQLPLGNSD